MEKMKIDLDSLCKTSKIHASLLKKLSPAIGPLVKPEIFQD